MFEERKNITNILTHTQVPNLNVIQFNNTSISVNTVTQENTQMRAQTHTHTKLNRHSREDSVSQSAATGVVVLSSSCCSVTWLIGLVDDCRWWRCGGGWLDG